MFMTKREAALREEAARLRAENDALQLLLAQMEARVTAARVSERALERRLVSDEARRLGSDEARRLGSEARQFDNLFRYNGAAQGKEDEA